MAPQRLRWLVLVSPLLVAPVAIAVGHEIGWEDPHHPGSDLVLVSIVGAILFAMVFWWRHTFAAVFATTEDESPPRRRVRRVVRRRRRA